ncbi:MAG: orotidine-5'-phosphate decarboxylase [Castellaniella sp.]|uniref:orotidine-5'-phosphate decarboxylase n=1 Tax=Castellaniella sp. TaxID=1955812 RepID=UPI001229B876|nr:orotidine-5'-phosphate decarboxylase [Castellaniella sp.]TAN27364.1 MAG: orotidine-5'-phosphate decarboxylase [Castellaniella sp.]
MTFTDKLNRAWTRQQSLLMVGLDPDERRLPAELSGRADAVSAFCRGIVDATAPYVCGFKPQIAYFAALKAEDQLLDICRYIHSRYPELPIVLDAKRGDIGATATQYAREAFERYAADAVTVNPYMGRDSVQPYLEYGDKGVIILCRTSNPGGADLQDLRLENGTPLYLHVADQVARHWNTNGQCALVVGATVPDEIAQVRARIGDMPLLIPGIGAQGGDIAATVHAGRTPDGTGMMINSSRAVLYAGTGADWAKAAAAAAQQARDAIRAALEV